MKEKLEVKEILFDESSLTFYLIDKMCHFWNFSFLLDFEYSWESWEALQWSMVGTGNVQTPSV